MLTDFVHAVWSPHQMRSNQLQLKERSASAIKYPQYRFQTYPTIFLMARAVVRNSCPFCHFLPGFGQSGGSSPPRGGAGNARQLHGGFISGSKLGQN